MSPAEFFTYQYYTWEYRGRGLFLADEPVQLEAPFIPFFRSKGRYKQIDEGKRHTLLSKVADLFKPAPQPIYHESDALDYDTIKPFLFDRGSALGLLRIHLPKEKTYGIDRMKGWLSMLSFTYSLVSFEIIGTDTEIHFQFIADAELIPALETYGKSYFPDCTFIRADDELEAILRSEVRICMFDFGLKDEFVRPIASGSKVLFNYLNPIIATLDTLAAGEQGGVQILFQVCGNQWSESIRRSVTLYDGNSFFIDDPDAPKLAAQKATGILYGVTIRTFGQASTDARAMHIGSQLGHALILGSQSPANEFIALKTPLYDFIMRAEDILLRESHRLGMILNQDELLSFIRLPTEPLYSKKLYATLRNTKAVSSISIGKEYSLGENTHNGVTTAVTVSLEDRLKHMHILGATGTGKSTFIAQLVLQDIVQQHAIILFDPHGDLADEVIAHIPDNRVQDVVLIDPSDVAFPIGINILEAKTDTEKEVLSSDLVAIFKRFATSWGDQMSGVLGNAILALLESNQPVSLHELRRFLIEKEFRTFILSKVHDPAVRYYWDKEFPLQKSSAIGPLLVRLDTFLRPKSIRNMVIQKKGIDFEQLIQEKKILIFKLPQGLIGKENAFLLGSLIFAKLHQIFFRRQGIAERNPCMVYVDEFHHFITPSMKELLSGVRKYNVGFTLAHQDLQQLQREDVELVHALLGNVYTRVIFRVGEQDAKKLQDGLSFFQAKDLQNLGKGEAIVRIEQPQYDCSVQTWPLPDISPQTKRAKFDVVQRYTRTTYAAEKETVESVLSDSLQTHTRESEPKREPSKEAEAKPVPKPSAPTQPTKQQPKEDESVPPPRESTHRYYQNLIKLKAESKGFKVTLEYPLSIEKGSVDVMLEKGYKRYAIEICITTDAEWETHNIIKCLSEGYAQIISVSGDLKQLERIKRSCIEKLSDFESQPILFFTPDILFQYLDDSTVEPHSIETETMKGYKINVTYESQTEEEMARKRVLVAKVLSESMRKQKKK